MKLGLRVQQVLLASLEQQDLREQRVQQVLLASLEPLGLRVQQAKRVQRVLLV